MESVVDYDWIKSPAAEEFVSSILHRGKRRLFGLLERPSLPPHRMPEVLHFKIFVCGKSNVGKTATILKMAGCGSGSKETAAIETTLIYWPARLSRSGKIVFFALDFWDAGESPIRRFDHILPACKSDADAMIFIFSFTDRSSFVDIPFLMSRVTDDDQRRPAELVVGTKADQFVHSDISDIQIRELSERRSVPVLRTSISSKAPPDGRENIWEVAPILNKLCDLLSLREQSLTQSEYTV